MSYVKLCSPLHTNCCRNVYTTSITNVASKLPSLKAIYVHTVQKSAGFKMRIYEKGEDKRRDNYFEFDSLSPSPEHHCVGFGVNVHLISWCRIILENLTVAQLLKKFHASYETRRFISPFILRGRHWTLSWAMRIQFTLSHTISLWSIYYHLICALVHKMVSFLQVLRPQCVWISHHSHALCIASPIMFYFIWSA
jgi:hypothetical protein